MLRRAALVRTDVSEELSASFIRITRIGEIGTTLAANSNRHTLRRNTYFLAACSRPIYGENYVIFYIIELFKVLFSKFANMLKHLQETAYIHTSNRMQDQIMKRIEKRMKYVIRRKRKNCKRKMISVKTFIEEKQNNGRQAH
jgi:hypothetical protein